MAGQYKALCNRHTMKVPVDYQVRGQQTTNIDQIWPVSGFHMAHELKVAFTFLKGFKETQIRMWKETACSKQI